MEKGRRFIDRTGKKIGYITITKLSSDVYINPTTGKRTFKWDYLCECGNGGNIVAPNLSGRENSIFKTSCGCNRGGMRDIMLLNQKGLNNCVTCKETKSITEFGKCKNYSNGLQRSCRSCKSKTDKKYRNDPRFRKRILNNKKDFYLKIRNDEEKWGKYLEKQRETRDYSKEYDDVQKDPFKKSKDTIRKLLIASFKVRGIKKSSLCMKSEEILGCPFEFFKDYIESQFEDGMNWLNHGLWHLDHKVPLKKATTVDELIKLNYWINFQPLWASDNLSKSDILLPEFQELYETLIK